MQRMRRGWAYAAAHAAHHRPHPLGRLPACPPHTRRAAWHAAHGRRSCSATLATHAARRSSSILLTPGSRRSLVDQPRRAGPPPQARRHPRRASRKLVRRRSALRRARPARDSSAATAARELSRLAAPCDAGRPRRFPRVGTPQRRPLAPSQQRPRPPQLVETGEGSGPFERRQKLTRGRFATRN